MKNLIVCGILFTLTGCATLDNYCSEHSRNCVVATTVVLAAGAIVVANGISKSGQPVHQNQPVAPNVPNFCTAACAQ